MKPGFSETKEVLSPTVPVSANSIVMESSSLKKREKIMKHLIDEFTYILTVKDSNNMDIWRVKWGSILLPFLLSGPFVNINVSIVMLTYGCICCRVF